MKKLISLVLTLVLALTLGACGIDNNNGEDMNIETPDVSTDVTENDVATELEYFMRKHGESLVNIIDCIDKTTADERKNKSVRVNRTLL